MPSLTTGSDLKKSNCKTGIEKSEESEKSDKSLKGKTGPSTEQFGEINDFYVNRVLDSSTKLYKLMAAHKKTESNVIQIDYEVKKYQTEPEEYKNNSTVRLPSIFWFKNFDPTYMTDFFTGSGVFGGAKAVCKKQWGSHIFLTNSAHIQTLNCYLNEKYEYCAEKASDIQSVYPVLKTFEKPDVSPVLVLGMFFSANTTTKGERTFSRGLNPKDNADGVWDITEDFIDSSSGKDNYSSDKFASETRKYAFYVCEGTRLIVTDDRGYKDNGLTRSLFQQGSTLILEIPKGFELRVGPEFYMKQKKETNGTNGTTDEKVNNFSDSIDKDSEKMEMLPVMCRWKNLAREAFFDKKWFNGTLPEDERDKCDKNDSDNLNEQRRVVIFLGATESQFNTVCWRLELDSKTNVYVLRPPDGARICDILTWKKGFQQIYARHRYQRLFESVLYPKIHAKLSFAVPEDTNILKRILGLPENGSSLQPMIAFDTSKHFKRQKHPEYLKPEITGYVRSASVEGVISRDDWMAANTYSAQPLHPPITNVTDEVIENQVYYLKYGSNPQMIKDDTYQIDGKTYQLLVKQIPEFKWKLLGRVSDCKEQTANHSKQYRIGFDWMVYECPEQNKIGYINSAIFFPSKAAISLAEKSLPVHSLPEISYKNTLKYMPTKRH